MSLTPAKKWRLPWWAALALGLLTLYHARAGVDQEITRRPSSQPDQAVPVELVGDPPTVSEPFSCAGTSLSSSSSSDGGEHALGGYMTDTGASSSTSVDFSWSWRTPGAQAARPQPDRPSLRTTLCRKRPFRPAAGLPEAEIPDTTQAPPLIAADTLSTTLPHRPEALERLAIRGRCGRERSKQVGLRLEPK